MDAKRMSFGLIGAGLAMLPAPALAGKEEDAFANAGLTVCDARLIGIAWSSNDFNTLIREAGEKIIINGQARLPMPGMPVAPVEGDPAKQAAAPGAK